MTTRHGSCLCGSRTHEIERELDGAWFTQYVFCGSKADWDFEAGNAKHYDEHSG